MSESRGRPSLRSIEDRNALVLANLGLVGRVLQSLPRHHDVPGVGFDADLYQMGVLGLMRAAEIYEKGRGARFSTFACRVIWSQIMQGLKRRELIWIPGHVRGERRAELRARLRPARLDVSPGGRSRSIDGEAIGAMIPDRRAAPGPVRYDLEKALAHCHTERQRQVLMARARGETLARVAERIGLSKQRVLQIQGEAYRAVRAAAAAGVDFEVE